MAKLKIVIIAVLLGSTIGAQAQWMKIDQNGGNPDPSAALEVSDTARGFLPPRLTTTQMNAISSPASGLLIFNTTDSIYKYYDGNAWESVGSGNVNGSSSSSNSLKYQNIYFGGTTYTVSSDFLKTSDFVFHGDSLFTLDNSSSYSRFIARENCLINISHSNAKLVTGGFQRISINSGNYNALSSNATTGRTLATWNGYLDKGDTLFFSSSNANTAQSWVMSLNAIAIGSVTSSSSTISSVDESGIVLIKDIKSAGTPSGTFTAGSWQIRDLNSIEGDTSFANLNSNEFTLSSGVYLIEWRAPASVVANHKSRLFNVTDASVEINGSAEQSPANSSTNISVGSKTLELTTDKSFRIEHRCVTTSNTNGFGQRSGNGSPFGNEIYTQVKIIKLDKVFGSGGSNSSSSSSMDTLDENVFSAFITGANGAGVGVGRTSQDFISSVTYNSTGNYTINFKSGFFTVTPVIIAMVHDNGSYEARLHTVTTSSANILTNVTGGVSFNRHFNIIVQRQGSDYRYNTSGASASALAGTSDTLPIIKDDDGSSKIEVHPLDHIAFSTNNSEKMRLNGAGDLGIGTTSPDDELVIIDTGIVAIKLGVDQTNKYLKLDYNEDFDIASIQSGEYGGTTHPLVLQGGGGQVGVGTVPENASLDIVSGASNRGIQILNNRNLGYTEMIRGFDTTLTGNGGAGQDLAIALGKNSTTNNAAWMGYRHYYDDSDSNSLTLNMWNNKYLLNITGAGNVGVGTQYPDSTLTVGGGIKTTYFTMTDGTSLNGKVLTSDANGKATWQTPAGSSSPWTESGNNVYRNNNAGAVIVGATSAPVGDLAYIYNNTSSAKTTAFHVHNDYPGSSFKTGIENYVGSGGSGARTGIENTVYGSGTNAATGYDLQMLSGTGTKYGLKANLAGGTDKYGLYITGADQNILEGRLGIGVTSITGTNWMEVESEAGTIYTTGLEVQNNYLGSGTQYGIKTDMAQNATGLKYGVANFVRGRSDQTGNLFGTYNEIYRGNGTASQDNYGFRNAFYQTSSGNSWGFYTTGEDYNYFEGKVGIGDDTPDSTLVVDGGIKTTYFTMTDGTSLNGKVLTANANGVASWQAPASSSPWTLDADSVTVVGKNVGIGTTSPETKIHIQGEDNSGTSTGITLRSTATSKSSRINFDKASDGETVIGSAHNLGVIMARGYDGANYQSAANIIFSADGAVGTADMPGRIEFATTPDGTNTPIERMRISSEGNLGIGTTSPANLLHIHSSSSSKSYTNWTNSSSGSTGTDGALVGQSSNEMFVWNYENGAMRFGTNDSEQMRIDSVGNVGIGTTSPESNIHVVGDVNGNIRIGNSTDKTGLGVSSVADGRAYFWNYRKNDILFGTDATERMRIDSVGNVGIGTSNPSSALHIEADGTPQVLIKPVSTNGQDAELRIIGARNTTTAADEAWLSLGNYDNDLGSTNLMGSIVGKVTNAVSNVGDMVFYRYSNGSTATEAMRITSGGNVGIGTSSPNLKLHVDGGSDASLTSGTGYLLLGATNSANMVFDNNEIMARNNGAVSTLFLNPSGGDIQLGDGPLSGPALFVDDNGLVGVGTNSPVRDFHVHDAATTGSYTMWTNSGTGTTNSDGGLVGMFGNNMVMWNYESGYTSFRTNNSERIRIESGGDVGIGTTNPTYKLHVIGDINASGVVRASGVALISDRRYKNNILPIEDVLSSINQLEGVYHSWDTLNFPEQGFTNKRAIGVIAQDIQKIYPELVYANKEGYLAVDYAKFSAVLLQAIKEQQTMIHSLKSENSVLKSEVGNLNNANQSQQEQIEEINAKLESIQKLIYEGQSKK